MTEPAPSNDVDEHIAGVASLVEPQRRALYRLVALGVLDEQGYEPRPRGSEVTLANYPFHALVDQHPTWCAA